MTLPAPKSQAHLAAMMPTGPAPKTTTVSPGWMPPISAPWYPVGTTSVSITASSGSIHSGMTVGLTSAYGTRTYSACPPS